MQNSFSVTLEEGFKGILEVDETRSKSAKEKNSEVEPKPEFIKRREVLLDRVENCRRKMRLAPEAKIYKCRLSLTEHKRQPTTDKSQ
jgi:hypothetical protein